MPPRRFMCGCGPCRPQWAKMVDSLYSSNHTDGTNKLVCYCVRKPDKLDNIAKYLHKRLSSDLNHLNYENVNITVEAMSALVNACYAVKLNLFDSSFLKMVQLLLESKLPELQLLGTKSVFVLSDVHRFSSLRFLRLKKIFAACHIPTCLTVRVAGIQGLQGVVRKTARDQLRMNVLQSASMDQIIPDIEAFLSQNILSFHTLISFPFHTFYIHLALHCRKAPPVSPIAFQNLFKFIYTCLQCILTQSRQYKILRPALCMESPFSLS
ncbi:unnamed protein product [Schistocephalus solidus]|uniref:BTB domain-containing protein n=1 Tax=Schistocephalus solidus TaxID=70667 RepID=A0A183TA40_SCHSO|nr:unnamed protein product [Schistocephalus solidus]